jgi:hypothetical protein
MGKTEKKQWQKPELIVLTRNNPEERVLAGCKGCTDPPTSGPSNGSYNCVDGPMPACYDCDLS